MPCCDQIKGYRLTAEHLQRSSHDALIIADDYRRGKLATQGQWVRQLPDLWPTLEWQEVVTHPGHDASSGSLGNYVVVVEDEGLTGTRNIGGKEARALIPNALYILLTITGFDGH